MGLKKNFIKLCFLLLIPLGLFISHISTSYPDTIEKLYSMGLYRAIAAPLNFISGLVPFSLGELLLVGFVILVILQLIRLAIQIFRMPSQIKKELLNFGANFVVFISLVYFCFVIFWGLNYQRLPFSQIAGLKVEPATVDELVAVCENLLEQAKELRKYVSENDKGAMFLPAGKQDALKRAYKGYESAARIYPELGGNFSRPKGVFLSEIMSYLGLEGIYSIYTGEANVNISMPDSTFPFTTCHEMAHQRGFAREDEANYIAYIVCKNHPDIDFQYSGVLSALIYAGNALYRTDPDKYSKLRSKYSEGMTRDLEAINSYWQNYETPVQDFSSSVNDTYLKANRQEDGVKSYGRMVDLLIAEFRASKS
ncbi:MAG TPA: DUF3810 domain-containing protein [Acetivibrio clariflavus]|nr:DUF3810 domain-containing protein [Acetivibrio clariflavus]